MHIKGCRSERKTPSCYCNYVFKAKWNLNKKRESRSESKGKRAAAGNPHK